MFLHWEIMHDFPHTIHRSSSRKEKAREEIETKKNRICPRASRHDVDWKRSAQIRAVVKLADMINQLKETLRALMKHKPEYGHTTTGLKCQAISRKGAV